MIIRGGRVALPDEEDFQPADLRIEGEKIVAIGPSLSGSGEIIDAGGLCILPGGIDPHVHFDDPGYTNREDFYHGCCAAASGGITTVIDMPCTSIPPVTNKRNLLSKLSSIRKQAVVDYGLFGGVSHRSFDREFPGCMAELAGWVLGFKTYFISGMDSFERLDLYRFGRVMQEAAASRLPVLVHAEDYDYVTNATREAMNEGSQPIHFYRSRPEIAERLAVLAALEIAEETGGDLHVVHIGTAQAARHFKRTAPVKDNGKEAAPGPRMTCETGPHYLHFDLEDFQAIGSALKVTPPVKPSPNKQQLWDLLSDGTISFVASDHAPCQEKEKRTGSVWTDYSGIPGCDTLLPFMFSEGYSRGRLTLKRLLEVTSENAARRYGLFHGKGSIETGKDADLVIIDPDAQWKVEGARSHSKGKITPFEGSVLQGRVLKTILRGRVIYDSERGILAGRGSGRLLRRQTVPQKADVPQKENFPQKADTDET